MATTNTGRHLDDANIAKAQPRNLDLGCSRDWLDLCITDDGKNAKPLANFANVMTGLRHDFGLCTALAFDEMLSAPILLHDIGIR